MIKVIFIAALPINTGNIKGGVESASINLLNGFSHYDNLNILVLSFNPLIDQKVRSIFSQNITIEQIPFQFKKLFFFDYFFKNRKYLLLKIKSFKPDIIHIQGTSPFASFITK